MQNLKTTLVQAKLAWEQPEANMTRLGHLLEEEVSETDLIVLPEMFTTGFTMNAKAVAESVNGPGAEWLLAQAARFNALVCGSVIVEEGGAYYNRMYCAFPDGALRHYDKAHLFRMAKEHDTFASGRERLLLEWRGWKIMPFVCYDLRFPVWCRNTESQRYDLAVFVANWPERRSLHWSRLLRARAIENLSYVIGVNRCGTDGNGIYYDGASAALDFHGEALKEIRNGEAALTVELDGEALLAYRKKFPAHLDADEFTLA